MANMISNYFSIKKPGSVAGPEKLLAKKSSASVTRVRNTSSVSIDPKIRDDGCISSDRIPSKSSSLQKIRSASLSRKEDKANTVVDNDRLLPVVKSSGQERSLDIECVIPPRKRKISNDDQEVKEANPPTKLIKLTSVASNAESISRSSCSNEKASDDRVQHIPTNTSANNKLKLMKSENIEKLQQLKKRLNNVRNELAKPVLRQEKLSISKASSVGNKSENSDKAESQNDPNVPAYQRFHALASKDVASSLVLPFKYKFLAEGFRCLDIVISLMYNRQEMCPFAKIKPSVEDMMRRKFDLLHLGQIKTVFPTAYHFQQEKLPNNRSFSAESQLTVTPNMNCLSTDACWTNCVKDGTKPYTIIKHKNDPTGKNEGIIDNGSLQTASKLQHYDKMKPSFLLARRNVFHSRLIQIVERFHNDFLATLNPPIVLDGDQNIARWHPKFFVDSVPEILPSELPKLVETQLCSSAIDVLHKIKGLYSKKMDDALELVSKKSVPTQNETNVIQINSPSQIVSSPIKGIPLALLEKIRAREAAKMKADMTRNPTADLRLQMMLRLPDMARILRNLFISEKKAAVSISDASSKISESYIGSVNPVDMEKHLYLLKDLAPDWISILNIRAGVYLKMNKTMSFSDVLSKIENARKLATSA